LGWGRVAITCLRLLKLSRLLFGAALLFYTITSGYSQERRTVRLSHQLSDEKEIRFSASASTRVLPETLRVLAVMVEFLPDNDPLTTGNGLFDTSTTAGQFIDAPPRDRSYFQNHLLFLQNYWRKVTNGNLIVLGEVVDTVINLSHPMRFYSPPPGSGTNMELGMLIEDVWKRVDTVRPAPALDFSRYQSFCIFHAGAGHDIDLISLLGFDPTPFDLPSVYLGLPGLRRIFGQSYQGVPVRNGSFYVTNSMILPETESRALPTVTGQFFLQLGINGLLAASLGSFLGLPDLFDTQTGRSGIGRFGLMDGGSIFSWNGVFPPEPSAWEKYFLKQRRGYDSPRLLEPTAGAKIDSLPAVGLREVGEDTILRVPISAREYFLVENRNRDARRDSAIVSMVYNNTTIRRAFYRDTVGFDAFDQSSLSGVIVDVDEFDWSLPGGVSTTGEFFDGGILVWHIDENVIDANYVSNTVNANPDLRGIDLEEADGSQDIGQSYSFLEPGSGSEVGTPLDFWFSGNPVPVYRNEFSPTSYPNSLSNQRANSHLTMKDFSSRLPRMGLTIQLGDSLAKPIPRYPKFVGRSATDNSPQFSRALFISVGDSIFAFKSDLGISAILSDSSGLFYPKGGRFPVAFVPSSPDTTIVVGAADSSLYVWKAVDSNQDSVFDSIGFNALQFKSRLSTPPVVKRTTVGPVQVIALYVGDDLGNLHRTSTDGTIRDSVVIGNSSVTSIALYSRSSLNTPDSAIAVSGNILRKENGFSAALPFSSIGWQVATLDSGFVLADVGGSSVIIFDRDLRIVYQSSFSSTSGGLSSPAIGDIDGDGQRDIVFGAGDVLFAMNQAGAAIDYFPLKLAAPMTGAPIVARLSSDLSQKHILVTTTNGLILAIDNTGKVVSGFPLATGGVNVSTPTVFKLPTAALSIEIPALFVADGNGYLYGWQIRPVRGGLVTPWGSYRGNIFHSGADETAQIVIQAQTEFFPATRAYNWPNPVYDGKTFIRYFVRDNAAVRIKIFDLAGELVDELAGPGVGGFDNEVEWSASKVESGIYFGRIEAQAGDKRGIAVIKIAVVK